MTPTRRASPIEKAFSNVEICRVVLSHRQFKGFNDLSDARQSRWSALHFVIGVEHEVELSMLNMASVQKIAVSVINVITHNICVTRKTCHNPSKLSTIDSPCSAEAVSNWAAHQIA